MSNPKISIIIPVHNQSEKLMDCLESVRSQTLRDFEVIIVDDGSDEPIRDVAGVRLIRQENKGAPSARNRGFKESAGQYVIFCDADVAMRPDMLAKMSRVLDENPDVSYVYSSFKFGWKTFKLWEFDADKLREMPYIHTTSLMRREHFPGFDESLKRLQDWDLWLTMLEQGHIGKWIPEALFTVKAGGSMSNWVPSIFTKLGIGSKVKAYRESVQLIQKKHHLD